MTEVLSSKTVRLAVLFAGIGLFLVLFATGTKYYLDLMPPYVAEYFALLSAMFLAIAGKNAADNYMTYRQQTTTAQYRSNADTSG